MDEREVEIQIVGGGIAGLVAAADAASRGLRVRVFEARGEIGGRAGTAAHHGYHLNQGPHALYLGGALHRALDRLGVPVAGSEPALRGAAGIIGDRVDLLPQGPVSIARTSLLSWSEKRRLVGVMGRLARLEPNRYADMTVSEWLEVSAGSGDLATLLGGLLTLATYNRAADIASADAALAYLKMAVGRGVLYLDGGWQQIVDQLAKHGANSGLVETVSAAVRAVHPAAGGGWVCETDDGEAIGRTVIVAAGSPAVADRLLGTGYRSVAGPPVRASVLDLGLAGRPSLTTLIGLDTGLYYSLHSVAADLAPEPGALVTLARYLPDGDDGGPTREGKELLLRHAARAGVDATDIVMDRYLHRLTVSWGMPLASQGGLAGRPPVEVPDCDGAFVAGDWVGSAGLLADASAASATTAVERAAAALRR